MSWYFRDEKTLVAETRANREVFTASSTANRPGRADANGKPELSGAQQLQVRCGANAEGVLQSDSGRQGHRAELEEVHLQGDLEVGRPGAGVLQESELPGAARMNQEVAWLLLFVVRGLACASRLPIIRNDQRERIASARRYTSFA